MTMRMVTKLVVYMKHVDLGNLKVSRLAMGCANIGQAYAGRRPLDEGEAIDLIEYAIEHGINLFDTAPSYGDSERILGKALRLHPGVFRATKVDLCDRKWRDKLRKSQDHLGNIDILQVHNATEMSVPLVGEIAGDWLIGASVYDPSIAKTLACSSKFQVLQVPFNLLDQRFAKLFALARRQKVALILRSPLLQGMLTQRAKSSQIHRKVVDDLRAKFGKTWRNLPSFAIRFALDQRKVVLGSFGDITELRLALAAETISRIDTTFREAVMPTHDVACSDAQVIDPRLW